MVNFPNNSANFPEMRWIIIAEDPPISPVVPAVGRRSCGRRSVDYGGLAGEAVLIKVWLGEP
jgi:hypothetical protein